MTFYDERVPFETLQGKTLAAINVDTDKDEIHFATSDKELFKMYHDQDCCEYVTIKDVVGDFEDLIGTPILLAEEASNSGQNDDYDTYTWTFYKLRTIKGSVDISWLGNSNGYYSESVDFVKVKGSPVC